MELPNITILDEKDKRLHQRSEEVTFPLDDEMIKTINDSLDYLEMSQDEELAKKYEEIMKKIIYNIKQSQFINK